MKKKVRKINNVKLEDLDRAIELKVITKCPSKWILIDEETGQVYRGTKNTEIGKMWNLIKNQNYFDDHQK